MKLGITLGVCAASTASGIFTPSSYGTVVQDTYVTDEKTTRDGGGLISTIVATTGVNATQATEAAKPTYDATGLGGQPCAVFAAGDNLDISMSQAANDWTLFIVHSPDVITGGSRILFDWAVGRFMFCQLTPSNNNGWFDSGAFREAGAAASGAQVATVRANSTGGNSASFRVNGTATGSGLAYGQQALGGTQKIANDYLASGSQYLGKIGRILIYQGNLSDANVQAVERALGAIYGITVA